MGTTRVSNVRWKFLSTAVWKGITVILLFPSFLLALVAAPVSLIVSAVSIFLFAYDICKGHLDLNTFMLCFVCIVGCIPLYAAYTLLDLTFEGPKKNRSLLSYILTLGLGSILCSSVIFIPNVSGDPKQLDQILFQFLFYGGPGLLAFIQCVRLLLVRKDASGRTIAEDSVEVDHANDLVNTDASEEGSV